MTAACAERKACIAFSITKKEYMSGAQCGLAGPKMSERMRTRLTCAGCAGVDVVGLYVFCSEAAYARAAPQLCRALDQMRAAATPHGTAALPSRNGRAAPARRNDAWRSWTLEALSLSV